MNARQPFRLTPEQYARLTMPIDGNRVGRNPQGFSHMEAWDIRRWLIRVFGFGGFTVETISLDLVQEIQHPARRRRDKKGIEYGEPYSPWTVVYRAQVRLTVFDQFGGYTVFEDGACGDSANQPSVGDCHDNAMKTALSQALKRCAVNLGDQFGLSLYDKGSKDAVVKMSLVTPEAAATEAATAIPADAPVRSEEGAEQDAATEATKPVSAQPAASQPTQAEPKRKEKTAEQPQARADVQQQGLLDAIDTAMTEETLRVQWMKIEPLLAEGAINEAFAVVLRKAVHARKPLVARCSEANRKHLHGLWSKASYSDDRDERLTYTSEVVGRKVASWNELSIAEFRLLAGTVQAFIDGPDRELVGVGA